MCLPNVPNPAGYDGNFGDEQFYYMATATMPGPTGLMWEAALEATYANGTPTRGDEIVFGRIRVRGTVPVPGTYRLLHPYGEDTFDVGTIDVRNINFTQDIGVGPLMFHLALASRVGPFLKWDVLAADETLRTDNGDGTFTEFLGDPNYEHTVTGSLLRNFVRLEGPTGANLDGAGNPFVETNLFTILGQKFNGVIPLPLDVKGATYSIVPGAGGAADAVIDVWATALAGNQLVVSGAGIPGQSMRGDAAGNFYAHIVVPVGSAALPASITVSNLSDTPVSSKPAPLADHVALGVPTYDPVTGFLSVTARTSHQRADAGPFELREFPDVAPLIDPATPWEQSFQISLDPTAVPPMTLSATSAHGGSDAEPVAVLSGSVVGPVAPVAYNKSASVARFGTAHIPIAEAVFPLELKLMSSPLNGSAAIGAGEFVYTPTGAFVGQDSFTYALFDPTTTLYSNLATVTITVVPENAAPVARADSGNTFAGGTVRIAVAANDSDIDGNLVPASVALIPGTQTFCGTPQPDGAGGIVYVAAPSVAAACTESFNYSISDSAGLTATASVTVHVFAGPEAVTVTSARFITSQSRWRVTGTATWFGPGIANSVTVRLGNALGLVIGTAPVDALGNWDLDVPGSNIVPLTEVDVTAISQSGASATSRFQVRR